MRKPFTILTLSLCLALVGCKNGSDSNSDSGAGLLAPPSASSNYTLTITKAGTGSGVVTSEDGGINCGTDCTQSYPAGSLIILHQSKTSGSDFYGWSGPSSSDTSILRYLLIYPLSASHTVTATFQPTILTPNHCTGVYSKADSQNANVWRGWQIYGASNWCDERTPGNTSAWNCSFSGQTMTLLAGGQGTFSNNCLDLTVVISGDTQVYSKP